MNIQRLTFHKKGVCEFCNRITILRYKVSLSNKTLKICTLCYEEQMDLNPNRNLYK